MILKKKLYNYLTSFIPGKKFIFGNNMSSQFKITTKPVLYNRSSWGIRAIEYDINNNKKYDEEWYSIYTGFNYYSYNIKVI